MAIKKKKVPLSYFQARPDSYFHLLTTDETDQVAFLDESERTRLIMLTSKKMLPALLQSITFELKRLDNSKEYDIKEDVKKIYDELKTLNSKQLSLNDFLINPKLNISELLNNSYSYFLIKSGGFDIMLLQQKIMTSFAAAIIKKYTPQRVKKKTNANLSQAETFLLRVAPKLSIFDGLSDEGILSVTSNVRFLRFDNEELIFAQGTYGEEIYYILSGAIQLLLNKGEDKIPLTKLKPGTILGELAPILKQNRSAYAYAFGETKLIGFHLKEEEGANEANQLVMCKNFVKILSNKLIESNKIIESKN